MKLIIPHPVLNLKTVPNSNLQLFVSTYNTRKEKMNLCSICSINGKDKSLFELFLVENSIDKTRCAWCRAPFEENLKATFIMVFTQPKSDTGFDLTGNFEPICESCESNQSIKSDESIHSKHFLDYNVNTKIFCKWCNRNLSYKTPNSVHIQFPSCIIYDSALSIDRKRSVVRKLFDCCCCNCS